MTTGIEIELIILLIFQIVSISAFGKFEGETPFLKKIIKWFIFDGVIMALYFVIGHWALLFILILIIPGLIVHFRWCKKNGIHPLKATPRKKYYELRGWPWQE